MVMAWSVDRWGAKPAGRATRRVDPAPLPGRPEKYTGTLTDRVIGSEFATVLVGEIFHPIDLETQTATGPDGAIDRFDIDPFRKECLLAGTDDISLGHRERIAAFENDYQAKVRWL
jgi:hypothetical protein